MIRTGLSRSWKRYIDFTTASQRLFPGRGVKDNNMVIWHQSLRLTASKYIDTKTINCTSIAPQNESTKEQFGDPEHQSFEQNNTVHLKNSDNNFKDCSNGNKASSEAKQKQTSSHLLPDHSTEKEIRVESNVPDVFVNTLHGYTDATSETYPHSAFEDDFLAGQVDERYLDGIVSSVGHSVSLGRTAEDLHLLVTTLRISIPFETSELEEEESEIVDDDNTYSSAPGSHAVYSLDNADDSQRKISLDENVDTVVSEQQSINGQLQETHDLTCLQPTSQNNIQHRNLVTQQATDLLNLKNAENLLHQNHDLGTVTVKLETLESLRPLPPPQSHSLAAYVNYSATLRQLVHLGIDLHNCARDSELAISLLKMDVKEHLLPRLLFLRDLGIENEEAVSLMNAHPPLLVEPLADMRVRVEYFRSKRFKQDAIVGILRQCPMLLTTPVKLIDRRLGFIFSEFQLTAADLRNIVSENPRVFYQTPAQLLFTNRTLRRICEFEKSEIQQALVKCPRILTTPTDIVMTNYHYLCIDMELTASAILASPSVLCTQPKVLRQRHQLLQEIGRLQLDPTRPNYVSLDALATMKSSQFYKRVAKLTEEQKRRYKATL